MWRILIIFISHVHIVYNIIDHDCPYGWIRYLEGNRCYRFVWYPEEDLDGARSYCQRFHSELVGVETIEEHEFIREWLKGNALNRHKQWLTSGEFLNEEWIWNQQIKKTIKDINGWHRNITFVNDQSNMQNTLVVYSHTSADNWKWDRYYSRELPFICEIDRDDSYKIEIDEFSIDYGRRPIQMSTKLEIERAPTISQSIFNVKFFDLNDVRRFGQKKNFLLIVPLECECDGFPLPSIQWYKVINSFDGSGLKKERKIIPTNDLHMLSTNGMLYIEDPNSTDTGNYVCIGRNEFGSVMSAPISLSRAILSDLEEFGRPNLFVTENSKAIVTCMSNTKSKDIEFTYSWSRNGIVQDVLQNEERFISRDSNLYISRVTKGDKGKYYCHVQPPSSIYGPPLTKGGSPITVIVEGDPAKHREPKIWSYFPKVFPRNPLRGTNVFIECVAEGYPTPSYRWERRDRSNRRLGLPIKSILKNFNRELFIPNAEEADEGIYFCIATNSKAKAENSTTLELNVNPYFTVPLKPLIVNENSSSFIWYCEALASSRITYFWYKNGELLEEQIEEREKKRILIDRNKLKFSSFEKSDSGVYQCGGMKENSKEIRFSSAQLTFLKMAPTFWRTSLPDNMTFAVGSNMTLICEPESAPLAKVKWIKDNYNMPRGTIYAGTNLFIRDVRQDDSGKYTCVASNRYGTIETSTYISVRSGTSIDFSPPSIQSVLRGDDIDMRCHGIVEYNVDIAYVWKLNNKIIDPILHQSYTIYSDSSGSSILHISNVQFSNEGIYICEVRTTFDIRRVQSTLVVLGPPFPPAGLDCRELPRNKLEERSRIFLKWIVGYRTNGAPITKFRIEYRSNLAPEWRHIKQLTNDDISSVNHNVTLDNLNSFNQYQFRAYSINEYGESEASRPSTICKTEKSIPFTSPRSLGCGGGKGVTLQLTWSALPTSEWNDDKIIYNIEWRKRLGDNRKTDNRNVSTDNLFLSSAALSADDVIIANNRKDKNFTLMIFLNTGQKYYQDYEARIIAINSVGVGLPSKWINCKSSESVPDKIQVRNVAMTPYNSTAIRVSWTKINDDQMNGKVGGYVIEYWNAKSSALEYWRKVVYGNKNSGLIIGLQPFTQYEARVRLFNSAGESHPTDPTKQRTFRSAPQQFPRNVKLKLMKGKDGNYVRLKVSWFGIVISTDEEPLEGYYIKIYEYFQSIRDAKVFSVTASQTSVIIRNYVESGVTYRLRCQGWNMGGEGSLSSPIKEFRIENNQLLYSDPMDTSEILWNSTTSTSYSILIFLFSLLFILIISFT